MAPLSAVAKPSQPRYGVTATDAFRLTFALTAAYAADGRVEHEKVDERESARRAPKKIGVHAALSASCVPKSASPTVRARDGDAWKSRYPEYAIAP